VFVSEGSERVKTATLSFKLNQVLSDSSSLRVQTLPKRTLTKGGEYDYHTFGYNQLLSGGTVSTSLCTCVWFLWRTTLYYITHIFEHRKQCNSTAIFAGDNQGNASAKSQLDNAFISACGYNDTHVQLICYGNLLYVKERLTIYNSLLKRSLWFSYGQHNIEWGSPTVLHVTRMNVMRKADNEHSPAIIEVMNQVCIWPWTPCEENTRKYLTHYS
jgi:hypothetical protein